jgi:hypothetical protein
MVVGIYGTHGVMEPTVDVDDMGRTSIQVSDELADELHDRKDRGDSYEEVIWRLIEHADGEKDGGGTEKKS